MVNKAMKITAYISGYSAGKEKEAAFAVKLECEEGQHKNAVPLGSVSKNEAEIQGFRYALSSITLEPNEVDIIIKTSNPYAYGMFQQTDGKWNNIPKKNAHLIEDVRNQLSKIREFKVTMVKKDKTISSLTKMAKELPY